ncbi:MarR family winged helix-turn-helix transcriptional regulator [Nitrolancea hollandica]|uniref:Transcriptional regulator, MarR family n=1 Tax=Nitrolancea hollandica Lb TaxID=1129897 RepID=I4EDE4_9BACT|nr:MarR family winged helix-turn-helix transcriptional regulator [Nitrolancea hollandica]CCF82706.1 Transcriptional regulator, MarR family [Nitrolancea hollandica Lb]
MSIYDPQHRRESPSARVGMAILRMSQAVKRLSLAEAEEEGLTPVQAQTLLFVRHTKSFVTSVGRLAAALSTTHVTAVGVVDGLIRRGLLTKDPSPYDKRVTLLRLTPDGERVCQNLDRFGHTLEEALGQLDEADLAALEQRLGALVWSLRAAGALQVAEPCRGCVHFRENAAPETAEPHHCQLIQRFITEEDSRLDCPDHTPVSSSNGIAPSGGHAMD